MGGNLQNLYPAQRIVWVLSYPNPHQTSSGMFDAVFEFGWINSISMGFQVWPLSLIHMFFIRISIILNIYYNLLMIESPTSGGGSLNSWEHPAGWAFEPKQKTQR